MKLFRNIFKEISGNYNNYTLENRIFNLACIISIVFILGTIVINIVTNLFPLTILMAIIGEIFLVFLYYQSRVKHRFKLSTILFIIFGYLLSIITWFNSGGSEGPMIIVVLYHSIVALIITDEKYHFVIGFVSISICIALYSVEYFFPSTIDPYPSRHIRYLDYSSTFTLIYICIVFILSAVKKNYKYERYRVEKQREEISLQNKLISKQYKNLENQDLIKIKIFSIIAHDLRGPLTSLQGLLNLLNEKLISPEDFNALSIELTERVDQNMQLLDNLLYWSNTQMLGQRISPLNINIYPMVESFFQLLKPEADNKKISLINNVASDASAYADPNMIKVVIRNLLSNAIKFTHKTGRIVVNTRRTPDKLIIIIEDNGIGMSKEHQQKLFSMDHFSTVGTANEVGTGLGLILAKDFVERNGGRIWVDSVLGQGSRFSISVPINMQYSLNLTENMNSTTEKTDS
ncbi:sensor histidine kinase [Solitalea koreensis]|uniref:histidine kinase n=1 Tax=Solitalea koreensis TaxID=543615 RepID=A0A521BHX6_9SPHI|nr:HAMP domain-containing sensor histidine kinase [Solitalea koreensis]SMO46649.1 Signal transduction histidine kinase [Solitalea koreensis]